MYIYIYIYPGFKGLDFELTLLGTTFSFKTCPYSRLRFPESLGGKTSVCRSNICMGI